MKREDTQVTAAMTQYANPLFIGAVDVDKGLDKLKKALDKAGLRQAPGRDGQAGRRVPQGSVRSCSMSARRRKLAVVAREAGVSISTVSKVLRAYPDVAPATRARVRDVLRQRRVLRRNRRDGNRRDESTPGRRCGRDQSATAGAVRGSRRRGGIAREPGLAVVVTTVDAGAPVPRLWLEQLFARGTRGVIGSVDFTDGQRGVSRGLRDPVVMLRRAGRLGIADSCSAGTILAAAASATVLATVQPSLRPSRGPPRGS